jgi:NitT/TauT family transport system permease protein
MLAGGWFTFLNAFKGFMVGCGLGVLTGILSARFSRFSTAILPLAIAANSVPIIAFAPIANFWFGVTSPNSKVAIVAVLCYFPAMISTVRGLTSVDPTQLELMRSYAATEVDIFRRLRIPNALPFMFSAFKLATTLSMIGAIVSEFFGGSLAGLGYRIREDAALFRFPESWAAIIVASLFGISFYLLISAFERAAMPWYQSFRSES